MHKSIIVDRIEGKWAVVEYGKACVTFDIPLEFLPEGIKEGDIIAVDMCIDNAATSKEKNMIDKLLEQNVEED